MENFSWVPGTSGWIDSTASVIIDVVESIILFHSFFKNAYFNQQRGKEILDIVKGNFSFSHGLYSGTLFFKIAPFLFFLIFSLRNVLNFLPAAWIHLESYDNQLSKWENRMLVTMIIKLYETHCLRSNTHTSFSNILIKLWLMVKIRINLL